MSDKVDDRPIKEWMEIFSDIYSEADSKRTPEQIWIAIMAHASTIGESIRTFSVEKLAYSAAHTFCWLCSFINKCNVLKDDIFYIEESLCGVVTLKYPSKCGLCRTNPCSCDAIKMEEESDKSAKYRLLLDDRRSHLTSYQEWSINNFLNMFRGIYEGRLHIQTLESIGFHFLEEVGEAAVAVRKLSQLRSIQKHGIEGVDQAFLDGLSTVENIVDNYNKFVKDPKSIILTTREPEMIRTRVVEAKMALIVEIGDTFSWFCSILNKLLSIEKSIWEEPEKHPECKFVDLETALNNEYFDGKGTSICPTCKSLPCRCEFFNE